MGLSQAGAEPPPGRDAVPGLSSRRPVAGPRGRAGPRCRAPRCPGRRCRRGRSRRARARAVPCRTVPAPGRARLGGAGGGGAEQRRRPGGDGVSGSAGTGGQQRAGNQGGAHRVLPVSWERGGGAGGDRRPDTGGCETSGDAPRGAGVPQQPLPAGQSPAPGRWATGSPSLLGHRSVPRRVPNTPLPGCHPWGEVPVPSAGSWGMLAPGTAPRRGCSGGPAALTQGWGAGWTRSG